jgi:Zinc knuckle./Retroviral aspartyl protease.
VQGDLSDGIQTTVRSRNSNTFDETVETALEKERAIFSKNERYRQRTTFGRLVCSKCRKTGHLAAKCYLKDKKDVRVNKLGSEARGSTTTFHGSRKGDIMCYNCGEVGHMAKEYRKPRHAKRNTPLDERGVEGRPPDTVNPGTGSANTIGSKNGTTTECVRMQSDISNGNKLPLLVDTGADVSLLKPDNFEKMWQFDPEGRVKVKSISGSTIQIKGAVQAVMYEESVRTPSAFQLADKRIDLPSDGILGKDFFAHAGAKICYETGILTLGTGSNKIHKVLPPIKTKNQSKGIRRLVLPGRAEIVARLPVEGITRNNEGLTEKQEIRKGVCLAGAISKVQAGYATTSTVNTTNEKVEIDEPVLKVTEGEQRTSTGSPGDGSIGCYLDRLVEECETIKIGTPKRRRQDTEKTCLDYQDILHLPAEVLSSTTA